jgi:hypothetical protein
VVSEGNNAGRVVRYDYAALKKLIKKPALLSIMRTASNDKLTKAKLTSMDKKALKYIKIGPKIKNLGHGQSIAYNPVTDELWMWQTLLDSKGAQTNATAPVLLRINQTSLKVDLKVPLKLTADDLSHGRRPGQTLAFDSTGAAWATENTNHDMNLTRIVIEDGVASYTIEQTIAKVPNFAQVISYNPQNDSLVWVGDDVIMYFPVSKIGELTKDDFSYVLYNCQREWEGFTFDTSGHALLLLSVGPEILQSKNVL